ncbi:MAG TPA: hypothetical protein VEI48_11145, partial [Candidatus Sulfotelmatobacter sp.]|nr:hypothetical protein [Candidatus Sulfotelmatobacter sp.]
MRATSRVLVRGLSAAAVCVLLAASFARGGASSGTPAMNAPDAAIAAPHVPMYRLTDLGLSVTPFAINAAGEVTGSGADGDAFRWDGSTFTNLGVRTPGDVSDGSAINASGEVAGLSSDQNGHYYAVSWTDTTLDDISGGTISDAYGINGAGDIVGYTAAPNLRAFIYHAGTLTDLNSEVTGGATTLVLHGAAAINDGGEIVGSGGIGSNPDHAFLFDAGVVTDLGTLPGGKSSDTSGATAVNAMGHVIGSSGGTVPGSLTGMFFWDGTMHPIAAVRGFSNDRADAINDSDWVVGRLDYGVPPQRAFVWPGAGAPVDLNTRVLNLPAGWGLAEATGINDLGQIVGFAVVDVAGHTHGFLLTPAAVTRLSGPTRFQTAAAISAHTFPVPGSADVAYIANAFNFPDALGG